MELLGRITNSEIFENLLFYLIMFFTFAGIVFMFSDFRYFGNLEKQCREVGYFQNKHTTILCMIDDYNEERTIAWQ